MTPLLILWSAIWKGQGLICIVGLDSLGLTIAFVNSNWLFSGGIISRTQGRDSGLKEAKPLSHFKSTGKFKESRGRGEHSGNMVASPPLASFQILYHSALGHNKES